jgi:hypothetical protein
MLDRSQGFVVVWRQIGDWRWYKDSKMVHLWIELLRRANHAPREFEGQMIERGQCVVGLRSLSESTGISIQSIRTILLKLKSTHEITIKSTNKYSLVTIPNYSEYQEVQKPNQHEDQHTHQQSINKQSTNNQQQTTIKPLNHSTKESMETASDEASQTKIGFDTVELKTEIGATAQLITEVFPPEPKKKTRVTKTALSDESISHEQFTNALQDPDLAANDREWMKRQYLKMRDHFLGNGERKANWNATFRNWLRTARDRFDDHPHQNGHKPLTPKAQEQAQKDKEFNQVIAKLRGETTHGI